MFPLSLFATGLALSALLLAGCAAPAGVPDGGVVQVVKSRGAVQCAGRGSAPEDMRAELQRAGVPVHASACGSDGRERPAVCGAGTGELNVFDIAAGDQARAEALGFAPLAQLRGAQTVPCR